MLAAMTEAEAGKLRVCHPTDLEADSALAFVHALRIAAAGDASLKLLHVDEIDERARWDRLPAPGELLASWELLPEGGEDDPSAGVSLTRVEAESEDVVRGIVLELAREPADLLVLGTQGRRGWDAWFSGSVAEPVARLSRMMTLFVRNKSRGFVDRADGSVRLAKVLVPICSAPRPEQALRAARSFPRALGVEDARITACFVGDPNDAPLVPDDVPLLFRDGEPAEAIVALAEELGPDLIVMATAGRHGVLDALRGSTTERVLREAPCPVLAVPAP